MDLTRIVVVSDTHGDFNALNKIILKHKDEAHCFIHLGDGFDEFDDVRHLYPDITIHGVRGNNDFFASLPSITSIEVKGKTIAFTHGHNYAVKRDLDDLIKCAQNIDADIILYGHSHKSFTTYRDNLYIMNPGSPSVPVNGAESYGLIDIQNSEIILNIVKL